MLENVDPQPCSGREWEDKVPLQQTDGGMVKNLPLAGYHRWKMLHYPE